MLERLESVTNKETNQCILPALQARKELVEKCAEEVAAVEHGRGADVREAREALWAKEEEVGFFTFSASPGIVVQPHVPANQTQLLGVVRKHRSQCWPQMEQVVSIKCGLPLHPTQTHITSRALDA